MPQEDDDDNEFPSFLLQGEISDWTWLDKGDLCDIDDDLGLLGSEADNSASALDPASEIRPVQLPPTSEVLAGGPASAVLQTQLLPSAGGVSESAPGTPGPIATSPTAGVQGPFPGGSCSCGFVLENNHFVETKHDFTEGLRNMLPGRDALRASLENGYTDIVRLGFAVFLCPKCGHLSFHCQHCGIIYRALRDKGLLTFKTGPTANFWNKHRCRLTQEGEVGQRPGNEAVIDSGLEEMVSRGGSGQGQVEVDLSPCGASQHLAPEAAAARPSTDSSDGRAVPQMEPTCREWYPRICFPVDWHDAAKRERVEELCRKLRPMVADWFACLVKQAKVTIIFVTDNKREDVDRQAWSKEMIDLVCNMRRPNETWCIKESEVRIEFRQFDAATSAYEECIALFMANEADEGRLGKDHRDFITALLQNFPHSLPLPTKIVSLANTDHEQLNIPAVEIESTMPEESSHFELLFSASRASSSLPLQFLVQKDLTNITYNICMALEKQHLLSAAQITWDFTPGSVIARWNVALSSREALALRWAFTACWEIREAIKCSGLPMPDTVFTQQRPKLTIPNPFRVLTDDLLRRIYLLVPELTCGHMATSRQFYRSLSAEARVHVRVPEFPIGSLTWSRLCALGAASLSVGPFSLDALLRDQGLGDGAAELPGLTQLRSLSVQNVDLEHGKPGEPTRMERLVPLIARVGSSLSNLVLRNSNLAPHSVTSLAACLCRLSPPRIARLGLAGNGMGSGAVGALCTALLSMSTLTVLDLSGNRLRDAGFAQVVASLHPHALCGLNAANNGIAAPHESSLRRLTRLADLSLAKNALSPESVDALLDSLQACTALRSLDISQNSVASTLAARCLSWAHTFASLELFNGIPIRCRGRRYRAVHAPATAFEMELAGLVLGKYDGLELLQLLQCGIDDDSARALGRSLARLEKLSVLDLSTNNIACRGMQALVQGLVPCTALVSLRLNSNQIGGSGAALLARAAPAWTRVRDLRLRDNRVSLRGTVLLVRAFGRLPCFKFLDLMSQSGAASRPLAPPAECVDGAAMLKFLLDSRTSSVTPRIFQWSMAQKPPTTGDTAALQHKRACELARCKGWGALADALERCLTRSKAQQLAPSHTLAAAPSSSSHELDSQAVSSQAATQRASQLASDASSQAGTQRAEHHMASSDNAPEQRDASRRKQGGLKRKGPDPLTALVQEPSGETPDPSNCVHARVRVRRDDGEWHEGEVTGYDAGQLRCFVRLDDDTVSAGVRLDDDTVSAGVRLDDDTVSAGFTTKLPGPAIKLISAPLSPHHHPPHQCTLESAPPDAKPDEGREDDTVIVVEDHDDTIEIEDDEEDPSVACSSSVDVTTCPPSGAGPDTASLTHKDSETAPGSPSLEDLIKASGLLDEESPAEGSLDAGPPTIPEGLQRWVLQMKRENTELKAKISGLTLTRSEAQQALKADIPGDIKRYIVKAWAEHQELKKKLGFQ